MAWSWLVVLVISHLTHDTLLVHLPASAAPGSSLEMQDLRPYLLNQDLHFNKISQVFHNVL